MRHKACERKGGVFSCLLLFVATLGLGILLALAYDLWNRPAWLALKAQRLSNMQIVKIDIPANPARLQKAQADARAEAETIWRDRLRKTAMEQFDVAYGWASLDDTTRQQLGDALESALRAETLDAIRTVDRYADWIGEHVFMLFGMENAEFDTILQRIYEKVNKSMLAATGLDDERGIEQNDNGKKDTNETGK